MRSGALGLTRLFLAGSLFVCVLLPGLADAEPALVQTTGSNGFAITTGPNRGNQTIGNAAWIHVLVTNPADGMPVFDLGDSIGTWDSIITLPAGWTLEPLSGPFFCMSFAPVRFDNLRNGVYRIFVVPRPWFFCNGWIKGDHVYRVEINNAGGTTFRGSAIGLFEITGIPE